MRRVTGDGGLGCGSVTLLASASSRRGQSHWALDAHIDQALT
ncbi:hypothetical protein PPSIR1_34797 [Plesiocystis pacifica SIR-1]|uniref:Uncharacterized protein n=1 Tax=Plesiocystis pacifica SIR-1 TaxID=391625 RepID=A6GEA0_9BACT|nr:hypothetical protein PPSIR1_34797 [Plesiocystis pacifica SIR-1]